ncbi:DUF4222 domain-containing protein [Pantoea dispersa]|uniref:DUF4222 domain-containing protein n=1 Tax=Pantoea TaxID=53335 RepID=UPI001CCCB256|nr:MULTISPECIES: DUF4222 domain-containing protein [Pantoea]MCT6589205.1 DUF4222 domain-containing protein [Pantoea dispersa]MEB5972654.1 DUF4222 domain-containing protein [Pantoea dispersa]UBN55285.1 DUF4222 domain-containing protein [Pantoea agglomerans]HDG5313237.1 DUF4222 domain-containing protein [Klebsiella pneumoniae]
MNERFVQTSKKYRDRRGIVVHVLGYDRQERRVLFRRPDYPHECCVPKWYFERYFREFEGEG